jgi:hypothetical protein
LRKLLIFLHKTSKIFSTKRLLVTLKVSVIGENEKRKSN